jgi:TRAP-type mannitol/chloroaromatic compound transport system permease small subunit
LRFLEAITRAIDRLNCHIGRATAWLIVASIVVSAGNALMRRIFGMASNFWLEAQWHLFGAAFLCAGAYLLLVDEHVRIDAVAQRFSPRVRAGLDAFVLLGFVLPLCVLMVSYGGTYFWRAMLGGEMSYDHGGPYLWPVKLCIPLGFGLLGLQAVSEGIKRIAFVRGLRDRPSLGEDDSPPSAGATHRPDSGA